MWMVNKYLWRTIMSRKAFNFIKTPKRTSKPRNTGLTMVLDKGTTITQFNDFYCGYGEYVDVVKFGWATSRVLSEKELISKCKILEKNGVLACTGGTFFEIAYKQKNVEMFANEAKKIGFSAVEISDGTINLDHSEKLKWIKYFKNSGFVVFSEVGSKNAEIDGRITDEQRIDMIKEEFRAGASKVIIESREAGKQGAFNDKGELNSDFLENINNEFPLENIIVEAPNSKQQIALVNMFGNDINLGNIAPNDLIGLETVRLGLRSDTLQKYNSDVQVRFELGPSGAKKAGERGDVVIIVDALRASTTILSALYAGFSSVKPVTSIDLCVGEYTAGERGGKKVESCLFDNSPSTFNDFIINGDNQLVITTANGTECIQSAASGTNPLILIGSITNKSAVASGAYDLAIKHAKGISIVCAGRNNDMANEDLIAASEIFLKISDASLEGNILPYFSKNILQEFRDSGSGKNLFSLGKAEDVDFCSKENVYDFFGILKDGVIVKGGSS